MPQGYYDFKKIDYSLMKSGVFFVMRSFFTCNVLIVRFGCKNFSLLASKIIFFINDVDESADSRLGRRD